MTESGTRQAGPAGDVLHLHRGDPQPDPPRPLADLPDDELMLAARGGVAEAFETLVRRHQATVIRVAHKFLAERGLALDAAQNTFVELLRNLPRYEARGKFSGYLFHILLNQCKMLRRSAGREQRSLAELALLPAPTGAQPEAEIIARERRRDVERALDKLPKRIRSVLILRFAGGLGYREIADILGVPIGTVQSRLASGLERLRGLVHGDES